MRATMMCLALTALFACACGNGGTQTDDDANLEDMDGDHIPDRVDSDIDGDGVRNEEDLDPRDPEVRRETGTISVTHFTMLAVLAEGQTVEPEIILARVEEWPLHPDCNITYPGDESYEEYCNGYTATGITAPAEIEVDVGTYIIGLRPGAGFYAPVHEIIVSSGATTTIATNISRNLTGRWQLAVEDCSLCDDIVDVVMLHVEQPYDWYAPCATSIWMELQGPLCLLEGDRIYTVQNDVDPLIIWDGAILDNGTRVEYTIDDGEEGHLPGPYRWQRLPD